MNEFNKVKNGVGQTFMKDGIQYYVGEYFSDGFGFGVIYKDLDAFEKGPDTVAYINEYGFENNEENATELFNSSAKVLATENVDENPYIADSGYTVQDLIDLCDGNIEKAKALLESLTWQCPETLLAEWDDDTYEENDCQSSLKVKTVLILCEGQQMTFDGEINPYDFVGITLEKEIDEVVDDCLVHVYVVVEEKPLDRPMEEFDDSQATDAIEELLSWKEYLSETYDERVSDALKRLEVLGKELKERKRWAEPHHKRVD